MDLKLTLLLFPLVWMKTVKIYIWFWITSAPSPIAFKGKHWQGKKQGVKKGKWLMSEIWTLWLRFLTWKDPAKSEVYWQHSSSVVACPAPVHEVVCSNHYYNSHLHKCSSRKEQKTLDGYISDIFTDAEHRYFHHMVLGNDL